MSVHQQARAADLRRQAADIHTSLINRRGDFATEKSGGTATIRRLLSEAAAIEVELLAMVESRRDGSC